MQEHLLADARPQLEHPRLRHQAVEVHLLEVEGHQLLLLLGGQVADVDHDREPVGGRLRQGEGALAELDGVHGGDGEAERGQLVGLLADGDRAVLQALEERALRLEGDAVDLVEQDHLGRGEGAELGHEVAGRGVDHLEPDDLGRLQVGAALQAREPGPADGGEDDPEEGLADAGHPAQQQVPGVHLPPLLLVVGGGDLGQQHHVGEGLLALVADEGLAPLGDDGVVEVDGVLQVGVHGSAVACGGGRRCGGDGDDSGRRNADAAVGAYSTVSLRSQPGDQPGPQGRSWEGWGMLNVRVVHVNPRVARFTAAAREGKVGAAPVQSWT